MLLPSITLTARFAAWHSLVNDVETETGTSGWVAMSRLCSFTWTVQSEANGPLLRLGTYVRTTKAQLFEPMLNTITIPMFKNEHIVSTL